MLRVISLLLLVAITFGEETYYCVQLATSKNFDALKQLILKGSRLPDIRVEKIGSAYVLRAGFFKKIENAKRLEARAKDMFPDAFTRKCDFLPERIVFPKLKPRRTKFFTYDLGMRLGRLYIKKKDFEKAEELYREMARLFPDSREVKLQLARVLFWQGKYEEALKIYRELERFNPDLADERRRVEVKMILEKVERLEKEGRVDEAIELLKKLYEEEKNYQIGVRLSKLLLKQGRKKETVSLLEDLVRLYPEDTSLRELLVKLKKKPVAKTVKRKPAVKKKSDVVI